MKNKGLKILGVGALVLVGATTLTGCGMNNEQMKLLEDKVAQFEQYMQDANEKLDILNNLTNEQSKLINHQVLIERAWGLLQTAQAKLQMNIDGVRDNLIIEYISEGETSICEFYKTQAGDYIYTIPGPYTVYYQDATGVYRYTPELDDYNKKAKYSYNNIEVLFEHQRCFNILEALNKEDITNVEILSNGNYVVSFAKHKKEELPNERTLSSTLIANIEVSLSSRFVSISNSMLSVWTGSGTNGQNSQIGTGSTVFKYGQIDAETILTKLVDAKAFPLN